MSDFQIDVCGHADLNIPMRTLPCHILSLERARAGTLADKNGRRQRKLCSGIIGITEQQLYSEQAPSTSCATEREFALEKVESSNSGERSTLEWALWVEEVEAGR